MMIQAFVLDRASANTAVALTSNSTELEYEATLTQLQPTGVPVGESGISVDWSEMTVNAMGNEFYPMDIQEVLVARYALTPAELEAQFLDLELIAEDLWRGPVASGTSIVLSSLTNQAAEAFAGIDEGSTWILALSCGSCSNPAPWYLSILEPCVVDSP